MKFVIYFLLFLVPCAGFAGVLTVTSKADSGPGTLRQAILDAAANGTDVADEIRFNIAGTTESERTIILLAQLPDLTSNLVIDGSTQPGAPFGVSQAKICLKLTTAITSFYFLNIRNASNIGIYGLFMFNSYWNFSAINNNTVAIQFRKANNIVIGKPGKGNYFIGMDAGIRNYTPLIADAYSLDDTCRGITIQSNIAGLDKAGGTTYSYEGNIISNIDKFIELVNARDVLIGGLNAGEGNYLRSTYVLSYKSDFETDNGFLYIQGNRFGTNINNDINFDGSSSAMHCEIIIGLANSRLAYIYSMDTKVDFRNNHLIGSLNISRVSTDFKIQSNKIYSARFSLTSTDDGLYYGSALVTVSAYNNHVMIGGETEAEGNEIFATYPGDMANMSGQYAITTFAFGVQKDQGVEIKHNKIYCNTSEDSPIRAIINPPYPYDANTNYPWAIIDSTADGFVKGKAAKNNRIDIYQDDECRACEGKIFLGSTTSDNLGNWQYTGNFTGVVVASATNANRHTHGFTSPWPYIDSVEVKQPTCGLANGAVKGVKILGGDNWEWRYSSERYFQNSTLYSTDLEIENLEPGYYWVLGKLGSSCAGWKRLFVLSDFTPKIISTYVNLTEPSCGQFTGSIKGMGTINDKYARFEWRDKGGNVVGTQKDFLNVGSGSYKFYAIDTSGGGCIDSSQAYVLTNRSGPTLVTANMVITHAKCNGSNGAINNISVQNASGYQSLAWEDSTGKTVSGNISLQSVTAGKYRLKFKDGSACDTIVSPFYIIDNVGVIRIDSAQRNIAMSACDRPSGAITGLAVNNANTFEWKNANTGAIAGTATNLINTVSGSYQLTASNNTGCTAISSVMFIPQAALATISITSVDVQPATCNAANGFIIPKIFSADTSSYTFKWRDRGTNTVLQQHTKLSQIAGGTYVLQATDKNGCFGDIYSASVIQFNKPSLDYSALIVKADTCSLSSGSIDGLTAMGGGGTYTWSWAFNSTSLSQSSASILALKQGDYTATVKDQYNCSVTSTPINVVGVNAVMQLPLAEAQPVLRNTTAEIVIKNKMAGSYILYKDANANLTLSTSQGGMFLTPNVPAQTTYYVAHKRGSCQSGLTPVVVQVFDRSRIILPNAFSPNGDGINDVWLMKIEGRMTVNGWTVFNRYGQLIFSTTDVANGWDGKFKNTIVPVGTYYWIVTANEGQKPVRLNGSVIVLR